MDASRISPSETGTLAVGRLMSMAPSATFVLYVSQIAACCGFSGLCNSLFNMNEERDGRTSAALRRRPSAVRTVSKKAALRFFAAAAAAVVDSDLRSSSGCGGVGIGDEPPSSNPAPCATWTLMEYVGLFAGRGAVEVAA